MLADAWRRTPVRPLPIALEADLIDLYTWSTPNGRKVSIMLEETGLPYRVHPVNIGAGEQHTPSSSRSIRITASPRSSIRMARTGGPFKLFESGAILLYLSWKTGSSCRFAPPISSR